MNFSLKRRKKRKVKNKIVNWLLDNNHPGDCVYLGIFNWKDELNSFESEDDKHTLELGGQQKKCN
jgi:hypothetical protein